MADRTTIVSSGGCNHSFHLIMSIITVGMWIPVWIIVAIVARKQTTVVEGPATMVTPPTGHPSQPGWTPPNQ